MKAAFIQKFGPPEVIQVGSLPDPEPGPGEVRVAVAVTALNPIDLYLRSGIVAMPMAFPYIIGCDLAGTVEKLGPEVTRFAVGDRVWGSNQGLLGRQGTTAQLAVVNAAWLYPTPGQLSDEQAAAQALTGITAHLGLFERAHLQPGETVYVSGGSGGVGTMVIQMAKAAGASVATTAGSAEKQALCRSLGADLALNYKTDDLVAGLRAFSEEGIDVWFETWREPDLERTVPLLRRGGRMILMAGRAARPVLPMGSFYPRNCSLLGFAMFNFPPDVQRRCADDMNKWASEGRLKPIIGRTFALGQAAEAERFLEENAQSGAGQLTGKVVITIGN
jgi:NADPH2:quinone reductase